MKPTLNEAKYNTLRTWYGQDDAKTLNELEWGWLLSQIVDPKAGTLNELWVEYLVSQGFDSTKGITAMQMDWFFSHGYSQPKYNERAWAFWNGEGQHREPVTHFAVPVTHHGELVYHG